MSGHKSHAEYFPGIDGLRAVAVMSVLLFHLNGLVPSGFVGVDVFFVISGFVVASAAADLPATRFRSFVAAFYARRLVRITPALVACLLLTMLVMALIVPVAPDGRLTEANTKTGLAAFLGASNLILSAGNNDYWSPRAELNPFTHTWSLGVEEQFYLVFPFLYFMWLRGWRRAALSTLTAAGVGSLLMAILWADRGPMVFYALPARFWELGAGVGLYFTRDLWRARLAAAPRQMQVLLSSVAAFALVASLVWADPQRFPWPWAALPVFATLMLIALVVSAPESGACRWLTIRPAVTLGKLSYSLYLWHWPLIVFGRWTTGMNTALERVLVALLSLILAWLSYRWIEQPVRRSSVARDAARWRVMTAMLVTVCGGVFLAGGIALERPDISLSVTRDPLVWRWDGIPPVAPDGCVLTRKNSSFSGGGVIDLSLQGCLVRGTRLYVAGDSHAGAYLAMLNRYAHDHHSEVRLFTKPGCGVFNLKAPLAQSSPDCAQFVREVLGELGKVAKAGDMLFLPGLRVPRYMDQWGLDKRALANIPADDPEASVAEAIALLKPLAAAGVRVVFEAPKPVFKAPAFRCADWFNRANPICEPGFEIARADIDALRAPVVDRISRVIAQLPAGGIWDPLPELCGSNVCSAYDTDRTRPLFFDGDHISGHGNQLLAPSFIRMVSVATESR